MQKDFGWLNCQIGAKKQSKNLYGSVETNRHKRH